MKPGERRKIEIFVDCESENFYSIRVELDHVLAFLMAHTRTPTLLTDAVQVAAREAFTEIFKPQKREEV